MKALAWLQGRVAWQLGAGAALVALLGGVLAYTGSARRVTLVEDGLGRTIFTHATTVTGTLRGAGLAPSPEDFLQPAGETPIREVTRIEYRRARAVMVQLPGETVWLTTSALYTSDILASAGVRLYPADRVWADGLPLSHPLQALPRVPTRLRLERGRRITLSQPTGTVVTYSAASTLGEALLEAGYELREGITIAPDLQTGLTVVDSADYLAPRTIRISMDGVEIQAMASGPTVGEALAQAGVALVGLDRSEPAAEEAVPEDGQIRVIRVREEVLVEQTPIPPPYGEPQYSPDLELDRSEVIDPGAYGLRARRTRVRYEDGVEVSRMVEGEWQAIDPRPRVVAYGTKIVLRTLQTEYGPLQYYRAVPVFATSYSPCRSAADRCYPGTSSGKPVQQGVIAVSRAWYYKLGWGVPVYVPGYGMATIEDMGGGIPGVNWIDLGYSDEDWVPWGGYTTLYFITPVPPDVPVIFP